MSFFFEKERQGVMERQIGCILEIDYMNWKGENRREEREGLGGDVFCARSADKCMRTSHMCMKSSYICARTAYNNIGLKAMGHGIVDWV